MHDYGAGWEAGDDVTLRLHVIPDGGVPTDVTTEVGVSVFDDTGVVRLPAARPDGPERDHWSALLRDVAAGEWVVRWRVSGTGSGVRTFRLAVGPSGLPGPAGRVYATTGQLAEHLHAAPPPRAGQLLRRASRKVDELLRTAIYATDEHGMPTHPTVAAALVEATCAQVEWWGEIGDDTGVGAVVALAGAQIGSVKLPGATGPGTGIPEHAPAAVSALRRVGLVQRGPLVCGALGLGREGFS